MYTIIMQPKQNMIIQRERNKKTNIQLENNHLNLYRKLQIYKFEKKWHFVERRSSRYLLLIEREKNKSTVTLRSHSSTIIPCDDEIQRMMEK